MNKALFFNFTMFTPEPLIFESPSMHFEVVCLACLNMCFIYIWRRKEGFPFFFFFKKKRCFSLFQPWQDFYIFFNNAVVKWHFCTQICWKFFFWKKAGNTKFHLSGSSLEEVLSSFGVIIPLVHICT